MGVTTGIAWTDHTFNPWIGCAHVSPGCDHCYAEAGTSARIARGRGLPLWGEGAARQVTSPDYWKQPLRWDRAAAKEGVRRRVFCASLADVFEDRRDLDAARCALWDMIEQTPNLDWLLLTKRPQNVLRLAPTTQLCRDLLTDALNPNTEGATS